MPTPNPPRPGRRGRARPCLRLRRGLQRAGSGPEQSGPGLGRGPAAEAERLGAREAAPRRRRCGARGRLRSHRACPAGRRRRSSAPRGRGVGGARRRGAEKGSGGSAGPMGGCVGSHHDSSGSLNENSDGTGGESRALEGTGGEGLAAHRAARGPGACGGAGAGASGLGRGQRCAPLSPCSGLCARFPSPPHARPGRNFPGEGTAGVLRALPGGPRSPGAVPGWSREQGAAFPPPVPRGTRTKPPPLPSPSPGAGEITRGWGDGLPGAPKLCFPWARLLVVCGK